MSKHISSQPFQRIMEVLGYCAFYLLSFFLLEQRSVRYTILGTELDRRIPFYPVFILPYLLWFVYIAVTLVWFTLRAEDSSYYRFTRSMALGCTVFLVISALCPNGQRLRPDILPGGGVLEEMVRLLYRLDTPTNVFPSIHVYNSAVCCRAILGEERLRKRKGLTAVTVTLTLLIIAATVFLKQHTLLDVAGGLMLCALSSGLYYGKREARPAAVRLKTP